MFNTKKTCIFISDSFYKLHLDYSVTVFGFLGLMAFALLDEDFFVVLLIWTGEKVKKNPNLTGIRSKHSNKVRK